MTREPVMIVAAKPRRDPVVRVGLGAAAPLAMAHVPRWRFYGHRTAQ